MEQLKMFYMDLMALTTMETLLQQSRFWNQSKNMSEASIKVQLEVSMYQHGLSAIHFTARCAAASRHELEAEVQRAIDRLSPKLRTITVLRYVENLSYEEIAEALEISIGTVKSRLSRAHAAMDRELSPVLHKHYLG